MSGSPPWLVYAPIMDFDCAVFVDNNQDNRSLLEERAEFNA